MKKPLMLGLSLIAMPATVIAADAEAILEQYAEIAVATYSDSLEGARHLQARIEALIEAPSTKTLHAARQAWLAARVPYMQSEVFRFGNPIVDDWEGRVNAWPLDEGLIDYVEVTFAGDNAMANANVVSNTSLTLSGETIDASLITGDLLRDVLHEADGIEANVATGYHAIEFLLWGQDLNGTRAGAGDRPWTDFASGAQCTHGQCERRSAYLRTAGELLIEDLEWITAQWQKGGEARTQLINETAAGLAAMLTGMGSLSYGELAGERMRLGLMLNDPEEEHDCFADNTHNSHYYNAIGIRNVYLGEYVRTDGTLLKGASLSVYLRNMDAALDVEMQRKLDGAVIALGRIKQSAEAGHFYDMMLARDDEGGEQLIMAAVNALIDLTRSTERVVETLGLQAVVFEGSDSLDNPEAVFQ